MKIWKEGIVVIFEVVTCYSFGQTE